MPAAQVTEPPAAALACSVSATNHLLLPGPHVSLQAAPLPCKGKCTIEHSSRHTSRGALFPEGANAPKKIRTRGKRTSCHTPQNSLLTAPLPFTNMALPDGGGAAAGTFAGARGVPAPLPSSSSPSATDSSPTWSGARNAAHARNCTAEQNPLTASRKPYTPHVSKCTFTQLQ